MRIFPNEKTKVFRQNPPFLYTKKQFPPVQGIFIRKTKKVEILIMTKNFDFLILLFVMFSYEDSRRNFP